MEFSPPLQHGILLQRYKRFLANIKLPDGQQITAHCPNPGAMTGCAEPGWRVGLSLSNNPRRKLPYTLEMVHNGQSWIGVNTQRANELVAEALSSGRIAELTGYERIQREVPYAGHSRVDFMLSDAGRPDCYLEVKSVTLLKNGLNQFPDTVTERGRKHLQALQEIRAQGLRAMLLFVVQREDGQGFAAANDIDPAYAEALETARQAGVEVLVYQAQLSPSVWQLSHRIC
ncbi:MAG: DNA/RNA nuclease SfsA [Candidatus Sericytochromatia bacterium]|nr:DNA/RNA nuclease SfsA [Candidatus Sericytochromatia bacterium]